MGGTVKGIIVEIGGDTSGLQKAFSKVNASTASLSKELRNINSLLKLDPSNTTLLAQKQEVLKNNIEETSNKLKSLKEAQKIADEEIEKGTEISKENYRALQREIENTQIKLNKMKAEASKWTSAGNAMEEFGNKVSKISSKVDKLGTTLTTGLTVPIATLAGATVGATSNFESSMTKVAATMGITAKEIEKGSESYKILEEAAKKCGETTKYSASEAAEALNYLALAGYDAKKSAEVLPKVLNLAAAGDLNLAAASDMVTDAMAALNLETQELDKYINEITKTSQKSNTSVAQLGEATLTCAGAVTTSKMSLETMNTELGILANNGIKGAEGGTHLRNIILSLTSPTDVAAKAIKSLGINVTDSKGNIRDLNDVMSDFNKKLDGMSDAKKTNIISTIFNKTDISAVNALIKGSGDEFSNLKKEIKNCGNAAQDMADTMNSDLNGQVTLLKSQIESISITTGKKLIPTAKKAVTNVSNLASKFSELNDEEVENIVKTGLLIASIGPATKIIGKLGSATGTTITTMGNLSKAIANVKNGVKTADGQVGSFTKTLSLLTNPTTLAVVGITAVTGALVAYAIEQEKEKKSMNGLREAIDDQTKSWNNLETSRKDFISTNSTEIVQLENLQTELRKVTDENGKVKEGYKDRAEFVLNQLNSALGTEYSLNNDLIGQYDDLTQKIQATINAKKADLFLEAYNAQYVESLKKRAEATDNVANLQKQYNEDISKMNELDQKINEQLENGILVSDAYLQAREKARESSELHKQALEEEKNQLIQYGNTVVNYENLQAAALTGSSEQITLALANLDEAINRTTINTEESYAKQLFAKDEQVAQMKNLLSEEEIANNETLTREVKARQDSLTTQRNDLVNHFLENAKTLNTLGEEEIEAFKWIATNSSTKYSENIGLMSPDVQNQLKDITNAVNYNVTPMSLVTGNLGQQQEKAYDEKISVMQDDSTKNLETITQIIDNDTEVKRAAGDLGWGASESFNIRADVEQQGKNFDTGISTGIDNNAGVVYDSIRRLGDRMVAELQASIDAHSPSRESMESGENFDDGIIKGVENRSKNVLQAVKKLGISSVQALEKSFVPNFSEIEKFNGKITNKVINGTNTIFTTPNIIFNVQEMNEENLKRCFDFINRKYGSYYPT